MGMLMNDDIEGGVNPGDYVRCISDCSTGPWECYGRFLCTTPDGIVLTTGFVAINRLIAVQKLEEPNE